jgi:flagellar biosynthesis/type III secretory pathway ATPase
MYALRCYTSQDYEAMNNQRLGLATDDRAEMLNKICDEALAKLPAMHAFLKQAPDEGADAAQSFGQLAAAVS